MPYDAIRADKAVAFINGFLTHTKGEWAKRPFNLEPWQEHDLIRPLFGTVTDDGLRQYRQAYIELPRKNGKSELGAAVALALLYLDQEHGGEVYGCAVDREQAGLVFDVAARMVMNNPMLARRAKVSLARKVIYLPEWDCRYEPVPADDAGAHGFNPHGVIFDELHAQKNRRLWDVMQTSMGARRQPLLLAITTAGTNRQSVCYGEHDYASKLLRGVLTDPTYFPYIRGAPDDADWQDEAVWQAANPALGVFRKIDEMRALARRARDNLELQQTFRQLYLNQWVSQERRILNMLHWDACRPPRRGKKLRGQHCYAGLDMANTTDVAALVLVFVDDGVYPPDFDVVCRFFIPAASIEERATRDRVPYATWAEEGHVIATAGAAINYRAIRREIERLADEYEIVELAYDRWGAVQLMQELEEDTGITTVAMGQGTVSMSWPTKELVAAVVEGRIRHGGQPVLRWMADNLMVVADDAGNIKPSKGKSSEKIDGIVALVMALDRALRHEGGSVYDERGVVLLEA